MVGKSKKKMLLALDGSDYGFETVRYISRIPSFGTMEMVLFHIMSKIPDYYWDMEKDYPHGRRVREIRTWDRQREKQVRDYLTEAKQILLNAGFPEASVTVRVHEREEGLARDLLKEARRGYSGVLVGRRGLGTLRELVLGSVASRLLERLSFVSLLVVGKRVKSGRFLVGVDGSEGALQAVRYVGPLLVGSDSQIHLVHVVRTGEGVDIAGSEIAIADALDKATDSLVAAGVGTDRISAKIITGAESRAGSLTKEAKEGRFGTIVVGRRGLSQRKEFFMGRVSHKVVQLAKGQTVWVVP